MSRRRWLAGAIGAAFGAAGSGVTAQNARDAARSSHFPFGPVVPTRRLDGWTVTTHQGRVAPLTELLRGKVSAVQLMFTGCSASCPIQGALFAQAQHSLGHDSQGVQFVSLSIDALGDSPQRLDAWLRRFGAAPGWWAGLPRVAEVDALLARLGDGGEKRPAGPDPHTGQVYLFDHRAELVLRTPSMPPALKIVEALREVIARG